MILQQCKVHTHMDDMDIDLELILQMALYPYAMDRDTFFLVHLGLVYHTLQLQTDIRHFPSLCSYTHHVCTVTHPSHLFVLGYAICMITYYVILPWALVTHIGNLAPMAYLPPLSPDPNGRPPRSSCPYGSVNHLGHLVLIAKLPT